MVQYDSEEVKEIRIALGITPKELGNAIGYHQYYVYKIELGEIKEPSLTVLGRICVYISKHKNIKKLDLSKYNGLFGKLLKLYLISDDVINSFYKATRLQ